MASQSKLPEITVAEAPVLPQVSQVRRGQSYAGGTQVARGVGHEEQRRELGIGIAQRRRHDDARTMQVPGDAHVPFPIGEAPGFEVDPPAAQLRGQTGGERFVSGRGDDDGVRGSDWRVHR